MNMYDTTSSQSKARQYLEQAFASRERHELDDALKACDAAIRADSSLPDAYNLRGVILEELGRREEAILAYREAIRLDVSFREAQENLRKVEAELSASGIQSLLTADVDPKSRPAERPMLNCASCGNPIPAGREVVFAGQGKNATSITVCANCASALEQALQAETSGANIVGAVLFGLGCALIAALVWYGVVVISNYQLGIVAVLIGWLVGQATMLGARRKRGLAVQVISVLSTAIAMLLSEYLIVRHFVVQSLAEEGYTNIPLLLPVTLIVQLIIDGIKADPMTLLFWGIALWEALKIPQARHPRRM